jgi:hypothetical protein
MSWAVNEFSTVDLGDGRLNRRLTQVAAAFGSCPQRSIPAACGRWSSIKGAYQLFSNRRVTPTAILSAHRDQVEERCRSSSVVLCINDTTEVNLTRPSATDGAGPLSGLDASGFYLHGLLAVTPERRCLGVLDAQWLVRDPQIHGLSNQRRKKQPIVEKESQRWPDGFAQVHDLAEKIPTTRFVYLADREGDIYELLTQAASSPAGMVIRSCQNRSLMDGTHLHTTIAASAVLGSLTITVPRTHNLAARTATLQLRTCHVVLRPPYRKGERLKPLAITVVQAQEINAPRGAEPLNWILLTHNRVTTYDDALTILSWYVARWQIEVYFRVLKDGCRIEHLRMDKITRIQNAISVYLIIAWRIMHIMTVARDEPDRPCSDLFEQQEWETAWIVHANKPPPKKEPSNREMLHIIAKIGGFIGRKNDGEPGPKTIWAGMEKIQQFITALNAKEAVDAKSKNTKRYG